MMSETPYPLQKLLPITTGCLSKLSVNQPSSRPFRVSLFHPLTSHGRSRSTHPMHHILHSKISLFLSTRSFVPIYLPPNFSFCHLIIIANELHMHISSVIDDCDVNPVVMMAVTAK